MIDLNEMQLPLTNPKNELEDISKYKLKPLFDVTKFEIREELKDKGIDYSVELKYNSKYTGFRFNIQLKATEKINKNVDGSYSLSIETSKIEYLIQNGLPAYYKLYVKDEDAFYIEYLNDFVNKLLNSSEPWSKQKSHVLRFNKKFDEGLTDEMYKVADDKGKFLRQINEKYIAQNSNLNTNDKIILDYNLNVSGDDEIRNLIEKIGFHLINEGRWKELVQFHENATGNVAISAKYNLIVGIAYYYTGNMIKSVSYLKEASKLKHNLNEGLLTHLTYFDSNARLSLGMINQEEYKKKLDKLKESEPIGLYLKLQAANEYYFSSKDEDRLQKFRKIIDDIIEKCDKNANIFLLAKCEMLFVEGINNNSNFARNIALINASETRGVIDMQFRIDATKKFINQFNNWLDRAKQLMEDCIKEKDYFTYNLCRFRIVKVQYEFIVFSTIIKVEKQIPGHKPVEAPEHISMIKILLANVEELLSFYKEVKFMDNVCAALSTKYELLHFINEFNEAKQVINELENVISEYDLNDQARKAQFLKNGGTSHEYLKVVINNAMSEVNKEMDEANRMIAEMEQMDKLELNRSDNGNLQLDLCIINVFPIGYFRFSKSDKEKTYELLKIRDLKLKENLNEMFSKDIIPVVNIYYNEIIQEGYLNGNLAYDSIDKLKNIYRVRKAFFENKIKRVKN